ALTTSRRRRSPGYTHWGRARNAVSVDAPLPGSAELGGVLGVLARTQFLGTNPAAWTTAPLG
ncbi:hypothetical protein, partial [Trebonia sp.]